MKRWAVLTVLLYALLLLALTLPLLMAAFSAWGNNPIKLQDELGIFKTWGYWLWLAIMTAGQALLLLLPINIAERRLPARRPLKIAVIVTAFFLAGLFFAGILSILCAAFTDNGLGSFGALDPFPIKPPDNLGDGLIFGMLTFIAAFWIIWAVIFRKFAKSDDENSLLKHSTRWLLRGSILELLVAVPSHIIARRRDDCCAPAGTFWGITTGISVMLLCFGPGVFFLFVEKLQRLKPKETNPGDAPKN
jgi:hypothetical protein